MALAQQTDILLLDERATFLDIAYQVEMEMLAELNVKKGITIVMVLHDINLSARCAYHIFGLKNGQVIPQGSPSEVITKENIKKFYDMEGVVIQDLISHSPLMVSVGRLGFTAQALV